MFSGGRCEFLTVCLPRLALAVWFCCFRRSYRHIRPYECRRERFWTTQAKNQEFILIKMKPTKRCGKIHIWRLERLMQLFITFEIARADSHPLHWVACSLLSAVLSLISGALVYKIRRIISLWVWFYTPRNLVLADFEFLICNLIVFFFFNRLFFSFTSSKMKVTIFWWRRFVEQWTQHRIEFPQTQRSLRTRIVATVLLCPVTLFAFT